jgi:site-specific recombinase XerD
MHIALTEDEARLLLAQPDRTTKLGMRDYAMLRLLIRLALRRLECAKLTIGDMGMREGHHVILIRRSKEEKDRLLKLPVRGKIEGKQAYLR